MGQDNSKAQQKFLQDFNVQSVQNHEGLGEFRFGVEHGSQSHYLLVVTNYSIPNKELAETEVRNLQRINDIPTSCQLEHFQLVKDKILCFDNFNMEMAFHIYP